MSPGRDPALSLRPIAIAEIREAFRWYEQQRSGLGKRFSQAVHETFAAVESRPAQFPRVRGEIRRALVQHFPYANINRRGSTLWGEGNRKETAMRKKLVSKLSVHRETLASLDGGRLAQMDLRLVAGGSARTACGSCPALSCEHSRCCGPTG